jgi:hypothetical protein
LRSISDGAVFDYITEVSEFCKSNGIYDMWSVIKIIHYTKGQPQKLSWFLRLLFFLKHTIRSNGRRFMDWKSRMCNPGKSIAVFEIRCTLERSKSCKVPREHWKKHGYMWSYCRKVFYENVWLSLKNVIQMVIPINLKNSIEP